MKHQSYQLGNLQEGPEGRMFAERDLPVQQLVQWVEGCSIRGWADRRMSRETECQESIEEWRQAEIIYVNVE